MRLSVRSLRRVVKGDLPIEFVPQISRPTAVWKLVRRYLHRCDVGRRWLGASEQAGQQARHPREGSLLSIPNARNG